MCSEYWTLIAEVICPTCGAQDKDASLQTHFMGDVGSCANSYPLREEVPELAGIVAAEMDGLGGRAFLYRCPICSHSSHWGASIRDGYIARIWPVRF